MKCLLTLLLPFLASCQIFETVDRLEFGLNEQGVKLEVQGRELRAAIESDELSREELEKLRDLNEDLVAANAAAHATAQEAQEDLDELRENALTIPQGLGGGGALTALGMAVLHHLRNRKYRHPPVRGGGYAGPQDTVPSEGRPPYA